MSEDDTQPIRPVQLSLLGASKGGRARAEVLTAEERKSIARAAARARWGKETEVEPSTDAHPDMVPPTGEDGLPFSLFRGTVEFGSLQIECHVLSDFRRVFTQREIVRVLSGGRDSGNLQRYVARNPLFESDYLDGKAFRFKTGPGVEALGYEAEHLIDICDKYIEAKHTKGALKPSQFGLVKQAEIVMRVCAKTGIIAVIDEATGFQKIRAQNALQLKLQAFIADELQDWARMFPQAFWFELARLEGIRYSPRNRPLRWGRYIMMFVYDAVDEDVGKLLREKNPNPRFLRNHHQWLKQHGRDKVNNQIQQVIAIMKLCENMDEFREKFGKVFKKAPTRLPFDDLWGSVS